MLQNCDLSQLNLETFHEALNGIVTRAGGGPVDLLIGNGFNKSLADIARKQKPDAPFHFDEARRLREIAASSPKGSLAQMIQVLDRLGEAVSFEGLAAEIRTAALTGAAVPSISDSEVSEMLSDADELLSQLYLWSLDEIGARDNYRPLVTHPLVSNVLLDFKKFPTLFTINYDVLPILLVTVKKDIDNPTQTLCGIGEGYRFDGFGRIVRSCKKVNTVAYENEIGCADIQDGVTTSTPGKVVYLHGAVHLFEKDGVTYKVVSWANRKDKTMSGPELVKLCRSVDRSLLAPLYVAGGTSSEKLEKVKSNSYLSNSLRTLRQGTRPLLVLGASLTKLDAHLVDAIASSRREIFFFAIRRQSDGKYNTDTIERIYSSLRLKRAIARELNSRVNPGSPELPPLDVVFVSMDALKQL